MFTCRYHCAHVRVHKQVWTRRRVCCWSTDDVDLVSLLRDYLASDGFSVTVAHEGESALSLLGRQPPDIAVVDVMMPGFSGIEVLRRIRAHSGMPVLMLTARCCR